MDVYKSSKFYIKTVYLFKIYALHFGEKSHNFYNTYIKHDYDLYWPLLALLIIVGFVVNFLLLWPILWLMYIV